MLFATRKIGRVRLVCIGRLCLAFGVIGRRPHTRRQPVWLSADGVCLRLPEIAAHG
ncbi:hypothetical protein [Rhizobium sp. SSA_523]|uniref:hypothetical protein n=1 Tax=Rhizobium sp. SSA_523 TaxID=2952477 RepID=UPI00209100AB|nr:hypothetical protein [Rhizobium sp. SSA_523]MCO5730096.1 hypothetical protein [Rhizobium sp. SSA_523]WKC25161.1 hypothetical protein QTJ18_14330 [Rhizobium sp. SSA_523]